MSSRDEMTDRPETAEETKTLRSKAKARLEQVFAKEWDDCPHNARFEAWADLYYQRFRRLAPGKAEPLGFNSSNAPENRAQHWAWHETKLANFDAIMKIVALREEIEGLERTIEDATDVLARYGKHEPQCARAVSGIDDGLYPSEVDEIHRRVNKAVAAWQRETASPPCECGGQAPTECETCAAFPAETQETDDD